jgi:glutamate-1-semialdehyde aminotransferase
MSEPVKHPESESLWRRATEVIPCGSQTLSKMPSQFVRGVYPKYLMRGRGCRVTDVDGHDYIDWPMALGTILLGHAHPAVVAAVTRQVSSGSLFTLMHPLEVEVAERLAAIVPCAEMVRFVKNGSDATEAAIRIARAYTGRQRVAYCGYHGFHDWFAGTTTRPAGVPEAWTSLLRPFEYNRIETLAALLDEHPGEYAAVILEQPGVEPTDDFLGRVRDLAHDHGAVFVWDEIVTGLRYARGGAQERYGVTPDLACFGKALGNGLPIAAVLGCKPLMQEFERVFVSMTYGGDALALAAARAVLVTLEREPVVAHVWAMGERWMAGARAKIAASGIGMRVGGAPPRSHFEFDDQGGYAGSEVRGLLLQECVKRGVLFGVPILPSYSHQPTDVDRTIAVVGEALGIVADAVRSGTLHDRMEGEMPEAIIRPAAPGATPQRPQAPRPTGRTEVRP